MLRVDGTCWLPFLCIPTYITDPLQGSLCRDWWITKLNVMVRILHQIDKAPWADQWIRPWAPSPGRPPVLVNSPQVQAFFTSSSKLRHPIGRQLTERPVAQSQPPRIIELPLVSWTPTHWGPPSLIRRREVSQGSPLHQWHLSPVPLRSRAPCPLLLLVPPFYPNWLPLPAPSTLIIGNTILRNVIFKSALTLSSGGQNCQYNVWTSWLDASQLIS